MQPKFNLGKITIKPDAYFILQYAGQEASFFLEKHAIGDWGEVSRESNEQGLAAKAFVRSQYRTLKGHEILVITFFSTMETIVFVPPPTVDYTPLIDYAAWGKQP